MAKRRDDSTLDLLSWSPPVPKPERFKEEDVRAVTLGAKVSKAVSKILKDAKAREEGPISRPEVAVLMSKYLGEPVSKEMLDKYCSEASEAHKISVVRATAIMDATKDYRLLDLIAREIGLAVVPIRFEHAVKEAVLVEQKEELQREIDAIRRGRK